MKSISCCKHEASASSEQLIDFDLATCQFLARQTNPHVVRNVLRDYQAAKKFKTIQDPSAFVVIAHVLQKKQEGTLSGRNTACGDIPAEKLTSSDITAMS